MLTTYQDQARFSLLVTAPELKAVPAFVYKDGQKTSEQRRYHDKPVYRLRGVLPLVHGEVLPEGSVYVTSEHVPAVSVGDVLTIDGRISIRAAKGFGLTGSIVGELVHADALPALELGEG